MPAVNYKTVGAIVAPHPSTSNQAGGVSAHSIGNKAPAFLMYAGDFLSSPDVQLMYGHEVGAYVLLLLNSWQSDRPGYIPNNENWMMRIARLSPEQWAESSETLLKKWPVDDNSSFRYNPRLVKEAARQQFNREQKSRAGQASAAKRTIHTAFASPSLTPVQQLTSSVGSAQHDSIGSQQPFNTIATPVATEPNGCSEIRQQKANLSYSLSTSIPSSLRSEGAAKAAPSHNSTAKEKCIPTLEEVQARASTKHPTDPLIAKEAANFFHYYESKGWRVGKTPMKKWQAAFDRWMSNQDKFQSTSGFTASPAPTRASIAPGPADSRSYS